MKENKFFQENNIYSSQNLHDVYLSNTELYYFSFMTLWVLVLCIALKKKV